MSGGALRTVGTLVLVVALVWVLLGLGGSACTWAFHVLGRTEAARP